MVCGRPANKKLMRSRKLILFALPWFCLFSAADCIAQSSDVQPSHATVEVSKHSHHKPDFNEDIYQRHRRDFSFESGWLPINIPFVYDVFLGGGYNMTPLKY